MVLCLMSVGACSSSGDEAITDSSPSSCASINVEQQLESFFSALNEGQIDRARESFVTDQASFMWFSDLRFTDAGQPTDTTQLEHLVSQLTQIVERREGFIVTAVRLVGEQNEPGLLEFNFDLERSLNDQHQTVLGKGAVQCQGGRFTLLLIGT